MSEHDLTTDDGLRAALAAIPGATPRRGLHPAKLDAAERRLGWSFPPLLRRVLLLSDGLGPRALLPLGRGDSSVLEEDPDAAGMLDHWAFFREAKDLTPEEEELAEGELGYDLLPIAQPGDPDAFDALNRDGQVLVGVYHDQGANPETKPMPLEAWLRRLLR